MKWISVKDSLPKVGTVKPSELAWLVWNGEKVEICTMHPSWWNKKTKAGDFTKVTHWMSLPVPPDGK